MMSTLSISSLVNVSIWWEFQTVFTFCIAPIASTTDFWCRFIPTRNWDDSPNKLFTWSSCFPFMDTETFVYTLIVIRTSQFCWCWLLAQTFYSLHQLLKPSTEDHFLNHVWFFFHYKITVFFVLLSGDSHVHSRLSLLSLNRVSSVGLKDSHCFPVKVFLTEWMRKMRLIVCLADGESEHSRFQLLS